MISDELGEIECNVVNEHVWWCIFGNSKDGSGDISTHDCAHWISFIYQTQGEGKSIYLRSGKPEADSSFKVYRINRLKEIIGHDMRF